MALIDFTGFDNQTLNTYPLYFFDRFSSPASYHDYTTSTRFGTGRSLHNTYGTSSTTYMTKYMSSSLTTMIIGFALRFDTNYSGTISVTFFDENVDYQCSFRLNASGSVQFYLGLYSNSSNYYTLIENVYNVFDFSIWNYFEFKVLLSATTGIAVARVNNTPVINLSNINTLYSGSTDIDIQMFRLYSIYQIYSLDDFYVCDATGSQNNDFLGDVTVDTLSPSANGTTNDGTASTGSNYECVDEMPWDDTDYVTLDAINEIELYTMGDLPSTSYTKTIYGVKNTLRLYKASSGSRGALPIVYINSTAYEHSMDDYYLATGFTFCNGIWELNPDDSAAWEEADINGMESGIKITV